MNNEEMTEKEMWAKLPALKDLDRVEMLLELSQKAAARNRPKDALALVNQAGQLLQICEGPDELIRKALGVESEYLASLDRKDEAVAILETLIQVSRDESDPFVDDLLRKQAGWFEDLGQWESELECHLEAIRHNEIDGDAKWHAISLYFAGACSQNMKQYEDAIEYYKKARTIFKSENIVDRVGWCDLWIAECFTTLGAGEDALSYGVRALDVSRFIKREYWITCSLVVTGKANYLIGRYIRAEEALSEAESLLTQADVKSWPLLVEVNEELVKVYQATDRFDLAEDLESRVKTIKEIMETK